MEERLPTGGSNGSFVRFVSPTLGSFPSTITTCESVTRMHGKPMRVMDDGSAD